MHKYIDKITRIVRSSKRLIVRDNKDSGGRRVAAKYLKGIRTAPVVKMRSAQAIIMLIQLLTKSINFHSIILMDP